MMDVTRWEIRGYNDAGLLIQQFDVESPAGWFIVHRYEMADVMPDKIPIFKPIVNPDTDTPEEIDCVMWWYKGEGEPPYVGCMLSEDFPGVDKFFAWCNCPNPKEEFYTKYNNDVK